MKKIVSIAATFLFATPLLTMARDNRFPDFGRGHHHMNAPEFAGAGLVIAALVGLAGYVIVRRRSARQN